MSRLTYTANRVVHQPRDPPYLIRVAVPGNFTTQSGSIAPMPSLGGSAVQVTFPQSIALNPAKKYRLAPLNASIPYTMPNVAPAGSIPSAPGGNDRVTITFGAAPAVDLIFPTGLYGYPDIMNEWNAMAFTNGWTSTPTAVLFSFVANQALQTLTLVVDPSVLAGGVFPVANMVIGFTNPSAVSGLGNSIGPLLGWPVTGGGATLTCPAGQKTQAVFAAPNAADFAATSQYIINCSIVSGNYLNGATGNGIIAVNLGGQAPNSIIAVEPAFQQYSSVSNFSISSMQFYITDQNGAVINSSFGEPWAVAFSIDETGSIHEET